MRSDFLKKWLIEINDPSLSKKTHIGFSERDLFDAKHIAKDSPITPVLVKMIHHKVAQHGYRITENKQHLYKIACHILLDEKDAHSIRAQWINKRNIFPQKFVMPETDPDKVSITQTDSLTDSTPPPSNKTRVKQKLKNIFQEVHDYHNTTDENDWSSNVKNDFDQDITMTSDITRPIFWVQYGHAIEELNQLITMVLNNGKLPILWRKAKGFVLDKITQNYDLLNIDKPDELKDPVKMMQYIIHTPKDRIVYIIEDFHHYIGGKDTVNPHVGDIRSLIKELHDQLIKRSEHLIFFVPDCYDMPEELEPYVYTVSKQRYKKNKRYLDRFGQLLTDPNYIQKCKPVIGVDHLIQRMIQILGQMESNNPLLIGSPGVGKTAVVEGFAKVLAKGDVIPQLRGRSLYSLSLNSLVAGTRYRGEFEIRLEGLMDEVLQNKDRIIVFIDEIHTLIDAGATEGASGASDVLKPVLARGEFPCIGATTPEGVTCFSKDPALSRRFKKIWVKEPNFEETLNILKGIAGNLEKHHQLKIDDDAFHAAVELSSEFIPEEFLPGKAISLIDGTAAFCRMNGQKMVRREDILMEIERFKQLSMIHTKTYEKN